MSTRIKDKFTPANSVSSDKILSEPVDVAQSLLTLKPSGITAATIGTLLFALFWNGFLVVWTGLALTSSIFFAMFSIPFWLIGLTMLYGILASVFGYQEILIRTSDLIVRKFNVFNTSEVKIPYTVLRSIELENFYKYRNRTKNSFKMVASGANDSGFASKTPTISYSNKQLFIGEHLSQADKEWLVETLNDRIIPLLP